MRAGYYLLKNDKSVYVFNNIKYFECVLLQKYLCTFAAWKGGKVFCITLFCNVIL